MHVDHVGVWVADLERARRFYAEYFGAAAGDLYHNPARQFSSYFLTFPGGGARLELMHRPGLIPTSHETLGYAHLAVAVGSTENVVALADRLRSAGFLVVDGPRRTGDGYFEAVVLDPDGNRIEITV